MSRWFSPQKAARIAEQRRKEKRRIWLLLAGLAVVSVGLCVADFFWLRSVARQRHGWRHHSGGQTNTPVSATPPVAEQAKPTNHE